MPTFGFEDLVKILSGTFDLVEAQAYAIRSRLKHMQLLGFPKEGVGKGFKAAYSIEDVMKVVVAFALLESGMSSIRACAHVVQAWPDTVRAMALSDVEASSKDAGSYGRLIVEPHALASVGRRDTAEQYRRERAVVGLQRGRAPGPAFSATTVLVDLPALSTRLCETMSGSEPATREASNRGSSGGRVVAADEYWEFARIIAAKFSMADAR